MRGLAVAMSLGQFVSSVVSYDGPMKLHFTVSVLAFSSLVLAACANDAGPPRTEAEAEATAATTDTDTKSDKASASIDTIKPGEPLATNAPIYASLYPEATLNAPAVQGAHNGQKGGMAEFTTQASPEEIMVHYRELAEASGLSPVMEMNQGNARAFGAKDNNGAELQVVAAPVGEEELTSVQLTWQASR